MYYEPDTVWGRTIDGDEEAKQSKSPLSIVQRRVLRELARPRTFASLAARNYRLAPPRLEHELIALAELKLVAYQRPGTPGPRTAPRIDLPPLPAAAPGRWKPPAPLLVLTLLLGLCGVLLALT
ncbi:MAG: hypothetical protein IT518_28105 [Burkholderiales bacterium]|nr:hypothetical protein [Burkholderiales bacterium]